MRVRPVRLRLGVDLRATLEAAVAHDGAGSGYVLSGTGFDELSIRPSDDGGG